MLPKIVNFNESNNGLYLFFLQKKTAKTLHGECLSRMEEESRLLAEGGHLCHCATSDGTENG